MVAATRPWSDSEGVLTSRAVGTKSSRITTSSQPPEMGRLRHVLHHPEMFQGRPELASLRQVLLLRV